MKGRNFNIPTLAPRVLVAPLDWGLGHATRCIPIIFKLLQENCEVIIAAEGAGRSLLQKEFPQLQFLELRGYRVSYAAKGSLLPFKLLSQLPKLIYRIYAENRWLKKMVIAYKIDAVISDNRMGLYHHSIPCIYITHQLKIMTGDRFTEKIAQQIHYHYINKFKTCWVPDSASGANLAGALSHPEVLPKVPVIYIGPLSRFEKEITGEQYDCCFILSGPEPQRTIFEKLIFKDIDSIKGNKIVIRGLPGGSQDMPSGSSVEIRDHLPAAELGAVIQRSKIIISRCGYSTVMDLVKLQKKALLVPTPGQTEQEYLGGHLNRAKLFYCIAQPDLDLKSALKMAGDHDQQHKQIRLDEYKKVIEDLAAQLRNANNAGT